MASELGLLFDFGLVLIAGSVLGFIAKELKQPLIVGYILSGILIGPFFLNLISDSNVINSLSQLGVAFLLFATGMGIDFTKLSHFKKTIILGGVGQIVITVLAMLLLSSFFGLQTIEAVYLGLIVAFSSSVIAVKILTDSKQLNSLEGRLIVGFAVLQDLIAVLALPFLKNPLTAFSFGTLSQLAFGFLVLLSVAYILSKFIFPRLITRIAKTQELFFLTLISSCFAFIFLSDFVGFPFAVGAFIGGLALGRITFRLEAQNAVKYLSELFGTVFFVALGLQLNAQPQILFNPLFLLLLAIVFVLNPIIFTVIGLIEGFGLQTSLWVGLMLFQASEFSFIIAQQGLLTGQLSQNVFDTSIWIILLSMIATPYMLKLHKTLYLKMFKIIKPMKRGLYFFERKVKGLQEIPFSEITQNHVVIAGAGVFGEPIATQLNKKEKVLVLEQDPQIVKELNSKGITCIYTSRSNFAILDEIGLDAAKMLIITLPDHDSALKLVMLGRQKNPRMPIFARAHYFDHAAELYNAGADLVIMPQLLAGNYCLLEIQKTLEEGKRPNFAFQQEFLTRIKTESKL